MTMMIVTMIMMTMMMICKAPTLPPIASNLFLDSPVFFSASARYSERGLSLPILNDDDDYYDEVMKLMMIRSGSANCKVLGNGIVLAHLLMKMVLKILQGILLVHIQSTFKLQNLKSFQRN